MRELERDLPTTPASTAPIPVARLAILGAGRVGGALARAARTGGLQTTLVGRDGDLAGALGDRSRDAAVLICVPDAEIGTAAALAAAAEPGFVGHTSGATPLTALAAAAEAGAATFSLHPLQTIPAPDADVAGAPCAVAGSDALALEVARSLATACGMVPFEVPETSRAAYHAAAAMASNFLVALEESAADALQAAGVADARAALTPLVLRTAANWSEHGAEALTGPIARGDERTVERHLEALRETAPELVPLYEALAARTRAIAAREGGR